MTGQRLAQNRLDELCSVPITWAGEPHVLNLEMPKTKSLLWTVKTPGSAASFDAATRVRLFCDVVAGLDDRPFLLIRPDALAADNQVFAAAIRGRNALYEALRSEGALLFTCPACGREHERDLRVLALALNTPWPPLLAENGIFVEVPKLADPWAASARPAGVPLASRLRFVLPSARYRVPGAQPVALPSDLFGNLHPASSASTEPVLQAWRKFERTQPGWIASSSGFRAQLRLSVLLQPPGSATEITPATVGLMPVVDFAFLDLAYFLTHNVDVSEGHGLLQPCSDCGTPYLPVR